MQSEHRGGATTVARSIVAWVAGCAVGLFTTNAWCQTYSLTLLPSDIPGNTDPNFKALARGISGDGNVIVGSGSSILSFLEKPYTWRKVSGVWTRSELPTINTTGRAIAASYDGSVIVGMTGRYAENTTSFGTPAVWRDTASATPTLETPLLTASPTGGPLRGIFFGVSANGNRAFGFAREVTGAIASSNAYRYDQGSAPSAVATFGQLTGAYPAGNVMSADGTRATHYIQPGSVGGNNTAFLWNESTGSSVLPINSGSLYARTTTICGDGRVVAGYLASVNSLANESGPAVIWRDGVFSQLARPNNAINGFVAGSDTTGRILVGAAGNSLDLVNFTTLVQSANNTFAAIWIDGQAFSLATYLTSNGVNLGTLTPILASGISADGRTVVGVATRPIGTTTQREYVSFVATIPTPGTLFGMSLWVAFAARRRR